MAPKQKRVSDAQAMVSATVKVLIDWLICDWSLFSESFLLHFLQASAARAIELQHGEQSLRDKIIDACEDSSIFPAM